MTTRYAYHRWSPGDLLLLPGGHLHTIGTTLVDSTGGDLFNRLIRLAYDWGIWKTDWDPFMSYTSGDDRHKWTVVELEGVATFAEYERLILGTLLAAVSNYLPPGVTAVHSTADIVKTVAARRRIR